MAARGTPASQGESLPESRRSAAASGAAVQGGGPPAAIDRARAEAERLYLAGRHADALVAWTRIADLQPRDAHAWLRVGNLRQRAGRDAEALDAYLRAGRIDSTDPVQADARARALLNAALLGIDGASRALRAFDALAVPGLDKPRATAARRLADQQRRAGGRVEQWRELACDRAGASAAGALGADPSASDASAEVTGPYVVDRWTGSEKRSGARVVPGRASVVETPEPVTSGAVAEPSGAPGAPRIEILRGGPGAARP